MLLELSEKEAKFFFEARIKVSFCLPDTASSYVKAEVKFPPNLFMVCWRGVNSRDTNLTMHLEEKKIKMRPLDNDNCIVGLWHHR